MERDQNQQTETSPFAKKKKKKIQAVPMSGHDPQHRKTRTLGNKTLHCLSLPPAQDIAVLSAQM